MREVNKYFLRGLLADGLLVITGIPLILIFLVYRYRGTCWDVLAVTLTRPCSFNEYLTREMPLLFLLVLLKFWWLILIVLLLLPAAGYALGRRRAA
jgi:hypothetical protein